MIDKAISANVRMASSVPRAARVLFTVLSKLQHGQLDIVAPGGQRFSFPGALPGPDACIELADWDVCGDILRGGDIGFAEAFLTGRWITPDLTAVLTVAALNHAAFEQAIYGRWWVKLLYRLRHLIRSNTRSGSRRNIHAHYDLGNDFYQRWLDRSMTYSSGLFAGDLSRSLEDAQLAKYDRVLRLVNPKPGERILEIGCGWGGFSEYAARTRGCQVYAVTLSRRQLEYARERVRRASLAEKVTFEFRDYRDIQGQFDHVVSIEMYEAVGQRFWPLYFRTIRERLAPGGKAVVQGIAIADHLFARYRRGTDFIQQYIFPGGMLASPSVLRAQVVRAGLAIQSVHAFGLDYAETLKRWNLGFNQAWGEIQRMNGFDARFKRLWHFYLSYCEAGFRAGTTDVLQLELTHA
jgi:cyclopropane-fatty-acyl-phospholipid synthase